MSELPPGGANQGRVVRVGDRVHRPRRANSCAVQRLLAHLESVGFPGAPRPLGFDEVRREVVSWVEGALPTPDSEPWATGEDALQSIGALIGDFRDACRSYRHHADDIWFSAPAFPAPFAETGAIGHNDVDFGNVVFQDRHAVALIDFDFASPSHPAWEVRSPPTTSSPSGSPTLLDARTTMSSHAG